MSYGHGWSPKYLTPALKIRGRLQDRVMFGCDFPALGYERVVSDWIAEGYSDEALEKLFSATPNSVSVPVHDAHCRPHRGPI